MGKFFGKKKSTKEQKVKRKTGYSIKQMQQMAENHLNDKINELADFMEEKKWTNNDTWVVFNIILQNDIEPKLGKRQKGILKDTLESLVIKK